MQRTEVSVSLETLVRIVFNISTSREYNFDVAAGSNPLTKFEDFHESFKGCSLLKFGTHTCNSRRRSPGQAQRRIEDSRTRVKYIEGVHSKVFPSLSDSVKKGSVLDMV